MVINGTILAAGLSIAAGGAPAHRIDGTYMLAGVGPAPAYEPTIIQLDTDGSFIVSAGELGFINVKEAPYSAIGNGTTDDTAAILSAITAAGNAGGGVVYFPKGTYKVSGVDPLGSIPSNVTLRGAGVGATIIDKPALTGITSNYVVRAANVHDIGIEDLTIRSVASGTVSVDLLLLDTVTRGHVNNVRMTQATDSGLFLTNCSDVFIDNIWIDNIVHRGSGAGGVGLWVFIGNNRIVGNNININTTDLSSFMLDSGSGSSFGQNTNCHFDNVVCLNYGSASTAHNESAAGLEIQGGVRCSFNGIVLDAGAPLGVQTWGILAGEDPVGNTPCDDIQISDVIIANTGYAAIELRDTRRIRITDVTVYDCNLTAAAMVLNGYIVVMQSSGAGSPTGTLDNTIDGITVAMPNGLYDYFASISSTGSSALRNRIINAKISTPGTAVYVLGGGATIGGTNGNAIDYIDENGAHQVLGTINTDGLVVSGLFSGKQSTTAAVVTSGGTILTGGITLARVAPAGVVTAVALQAGTKDAQEVTVVNEAVAANIITFDVTANSLVASGVATVIPGLSAQKFVWNSGQSRWYPVTPGATIGTMLAGDGSATKAAFGFISEQGLGIKRRGGGILGLAADNYFQFTSEADGMYAQITYGNAGTGGEIGFSAAPGSSIDTYFARVAADAGRIPATVYGGVGASASLTLKSTTNATKGAVNVQGDSGGTLGFYGVTAIARAVLATGALHTVDEVITALQNLGLVKQS